MRQSDLSALIRSPDYAARGQNAACSAPDRLAIYRNNLRHNLVEALAKRFPACERLLGDACFASYALAFMAEHLPSSPVLIDYGADFPDFLDAQPQLSSWPYLADVARIDWARCVAYHAADLQALHVTPPDPTAMMALLEQRFAMHPAASVLSSRYPSADIWQWSGAPEQLAHLSWREQEIAITRAHFAVEVREVPRGTRAAFDALRDDVTLIEAVERTALADSRVDPSALIATFLQCDLLICNKDIEP